MNLITVKVKWGSKISSVTEDANGVIIARVKSRPIKRADNEELIMLLAYYFKTSTSSISIKSGYTSHIKTIQIE
ncbi:MAG: DUF167 family protein [Patescibacteria group bacterium]